MRILRTYVLREHLAPFFITLGGLTGVLLVGNIVKFAELVIAKGVLPVDIVRLLLYLIPYLLSFTVPMACLVAITLAFGRLSADYELIAMRASGVAPIRLVTPMLLAGLVVSAALVVINDRLVPASHLAFRRQLKAIGVKQPTAYLEAGMFIKEFPPYVIFVYQVDGNEVDGVRIYEPQPTGPTRTIIAQHGAFAPQPDGRRVALRLFNGTVDEWDPARPGSFYKVTFTTYTMILQPAGEDPTALGKKLKEMTCKELSREQQRLRVQGIDPTPVSLELHRKLAGSFAALLFVMFGLAFGLRLAHQERLVTYLWILGVFVVYYLASVGMEVVAMKGWLRPWLAMWVPNVVGTAVSGVLLARTVRR
jgi:lipopolysaccharide export system permease protein